MERRPVEEDGTRLLESPSVTAITSAVTIAVRISRQESAATFSGTPLSVGRNLDERRLLLWSILTGESPDGSRPAREVSFSPLPLDLLLFSGPRSVSLVDACGS